MRAIHLPSLLLVASALFGCSSSDAPEAPRGAGSLTEGNCASHNGDDAQATCERFGRVVCEYEARCNPRMMGSKSVDQCVENNKLYWLNQMSLPGTMLTVGTFWLATKAYLPTTCQVQDVWAADKSCQATGSLPNDAVCLEDYQCSSGYCKASSTGCGKCTSMIPNGGACDSSTYPASDCESGFCIKNTCTSYNRNTKNLGDRCEYANDCVRALACNNGVCSEPVFAKAGESCKDWSECEYGLVCVKDKCAVPNGSCSGNDSDCGPGLYCDDFDVCRNQGSLGDTCHFYNECLLDYACLDSKCSFIDMSVCK
jgi:hypothetical protein